MPRFSYPCEDQVFFVNTSSEVALTDIACTQTAQLMYKLSLGEKSPYHVQMSEKHLASNHDKNASVSVQNDLLCIYTYAFYNSCQRTAFEIVKSCTMESHLCVSRAKSFKTTCFTTLGYVYFIHVLYFGGKLIGPSQNLLPKQTV